jgi:hypothetical protein
MDFSQVGSLPPLERKKSGNSASHCTLICELPFPVVISPVDACAAVRYDYAKANWDYFSYVLLTQNITGIVSIAGSVTDAADAFNAFVLAIIDEIVPKVRRPGSRHKVMPWFNADIKREMRKRDKLYKDLKCDALTDIDEIRVIKSKYTKQSKIVTKLIRVANRRSLYDNFAGIRSQGDFWKAYRRANTAQPKMPEIQRPDGSRATTSPEKATALSDQLQSVWAGQPNLPPPTTAPDQDNDLDLVHNYIDVYDAYVGTPQRA